jgi:hypothetical protein
MGLFTKTFYLILEQTWNSGYVNMFAMKSGGKNKGGDPFDPFKKSNKAPRHRRSIPLDPYKRKHTQTVPDMHKPDFDIIKQVESLKKNPTVRVPVNIAQLKEICKKYGIDSVSKLQPKKLGNTGIMILWDRITNSFILKK